MELTGGPDQPPTKSGLSLVDFCAGYVTALATLGRGLAGAARRPRLRRRPPLYEPALAQLTYIGVGPPLRDSSLAGWPTRPTRRWSRSRRSCTADGWTWSRARNSACGERFCDAIGRAGAGLGTSASRTSPRATATGTCSFSARRRPLGAQHGGVARAARPRTGSRAVRSTTCRPRSQIRRRPPGRTSSRTSTRRRGCRRPGVPVPPLLWHDGAGARAAPRRAHARCPPRSLRLRRGAPAGTGRCRRLRRLRRFSLSPGFRCEGSARRALDRGVDVLRGGRKQRHRRLGLGRLDERLLDRRDEPGRIGGKRSCRTVAGRRSKAGISSRRRSARAAAHSINATSTHAPAMTPAIAPASRSATPAAVATAARKSTSSSRRGIAGRRRMGAQTELTHAYDVARGLWLSSAFSRRIRLRQARPAETTDVGL